MDPSTVDAVKSVIRERHGDDVSIDVSPSLERLETFFLRIVQDAQKPSPSAASSDGDEGEGEGEEKKEKKGSS